MIKTQRLIRLVGAFALVFILLAVALAYFIWRSNWRFMLDELGSYVTSLEATQDYVIMEIDEEASHRGRLYFRACNNTDYTHIFGSDPVLLIRVGERWRYLEYASTATFLDNSWMIEGNSHIDGVIGLRHLFGTLGRGEHRIIMEAYRFYFDAYDWRSEALSVVGVFELR